MFRSAAALSGLVALVLLTGGCSKHYSYAPRHAAGASTDSSTPGPTAPAVRSHIVRYSMTGNVLATNMSYDDPTKDQTVTAPPATMPWTLSLPLIAQPGAYKSLMVSASSTQFTPGSVPNFSCQIWVDDRMVAHDSGIFAMCTYMYQEPAG